MRCSKEFSSLNTKERKVIAKLQGDYDAAWFQQQALVC